MRPGDLHPPEKFYCYSRQSAGFTFDEAGAKPLHRKDQNYVMIMAEIK